MKVDMNKYHPKLKVMHWIMAVLVLLMLLIGWMMAEKVVPEDASYRGFVYMMHKSTGILILILIFVRLYFRLSTYVPPLPREFSRFEAKLASVTHFCFYVLLFILPINGWLMSNFAGRDAVFFGVNLPKLVSPDEFAAGIARASHSYIAYTLLALVGLHILGALFHRYIDRKDVLQRML